jgi:hypothetical protein
MESGEASSVLAHRRKVCGRSCSALGVVLVLLHSSLGPDLRFDEAKTMDR